MKTIVLTRVDDPNTTDQDNQIITRLAMDGYMLKETSLAPGKRLLSFSTEKRCTRKILAALEDELRVAYNDKTIEVEFD